MRYAYADANQLSQIRWLRVTILGLLVTLALTLIGWMQAARTQRLSLPPLLEYGAVITSNEIQPWEVYNYAGYVWQALNRCAQDCAEELPRRQLELRALITADFAAALSQDRAARRAELAGRERYLIPVPTTWTNELVNHVAPSRWIVQLDMIAVERIGTTEVKRVPIRYRLVVVAQDIDPVYNPWGLFLHQHASPPVRIQTP